jgi:hypothetical protein
MTGDLPFPIHSVEILVYKSRPLRTPFLVLSQTNLTCLLPLVISRLSVRLFLLQHRYHHGPTSLGTFVAQALT